MRVAVRPPRPAGRPPSSSSAHPLPPVRRLPLRDQRFGDDVADPHAGVERAHRVLEDHLQPLAQEPQPPLGQPGDVGAVDERRGPTVGWSSPASSRSRVDLPQPDSPTMPNRSPARDVEAHAAQRVDDRPGPGQRGARAAVVAGHVPDAERERLVSHGSRSGRPSRAGRAPTGVVAGEAASPRPAPVHAGTVLADRRWRAGSGCGTRSRPGTGRRRAPSRRWCAAGRARRRRSRSEAASRPCGVAVPRPGEHLARPGPPRRRARRTSPAPARTTVATTARSWVMNSSAASRASTPRTMRSSTRACTVTSSAVVGSSQISSAGSLASAMASDHPLALAAGELVRVGAGRVAPGRAGRPGPAARRRAARGLRRSGRGAVDQHRLGDLVADPHGRVERGHRLLEDHGDVAAADAGQPPLAAPTRSWSTPGEPHRAGRPRASSGSSPMSASAVSDLPEPDSPISPTRSPRPMPKDDVVDEVGVADAHAQVAGRRMTRVLPAAVERRRRSSAVLQPRVEAVAQAVAEQVEPEHGERRSRARGRAPAAAR